jgi:hypothetical protein
MIFLQGSWIIAFVCAFVFYSAGKQDGTIQGGANHSILWAGLSIGVSAVVIQVIGAGWLLVLLAQIGLFVSQSEPFVFSGSSDRRERRIRGDVILKWACDSVREYPHAGY